MHSLIRSAAILFVIFALARPTSEVVQPVVLEAIVWDRSSSVSDEEDARAAEAIRLRLEGSPETEWSMVVLEEAEAPREEVGEEAGRALPPALSDAWDSALKTKSWRRGLCETIRR